MSDYVVERVALAVAATGLIGYEPGCHEYRDIARAAIEAMREPTEAMLIGARDWSLRKNGQGVGDDQATGCWQAMIYAALA